MKKTSEKFQEYAKQYPHITSSIQSCQEKLGEELGEDQTTTLIRTHFNKYPQYLEDTGSGETLAQHTEKVLAQFQKHFASSFNSKFANIPSKFFQLLLRIHDIGAPIANRESSKKNQHIYSEPLIREILKQAGYNREMIELGVAITCNDPIGGFLQKKITPLQSIRKIDSILAKCKKLISAERLFELLETLHKCDASSYHSLTHLFQKKEGNIAYSQGTKEQVTILEKHRKDYQNRPRKSYKFTSKEPKKRNQQVQEIIKESGYKPHEVVVRVFNRDYLPHVNLTGTDRYFKDSDHRLSIHLDTSGLDNFLKNNGYETEDGFYGFSAGWYPPTTLGNANPQKYAILIYEKSKLEQLSKYTKEPSHKDARIFEDPQQKKKALKFVLYDENTESQLMIDYKKLKTLTKRKEFIQTRIEGKQIELSEKGEKDLDKFIIETQEIIQIFYQQHSEEKITHYWLQQIKNSKEIYGDIRDPILFYQKKINGNINNGNTKDKTTNHNKKILKRLETTFFNNKKEIEKAKVTIPSIQNVWKDVKKENQRLIKIYKIGSNGITTSIKNKLSKMLGVFKNN